MVGAELLGERLAAREDQAARVAPGVRDLEQFEVADDVVVEDDLAVELLEQVEDDVRAGTAPTASRTGASSYWTPSGAHLVAAAAQRGRRRRTRSSSC